MNNRVKTGINGLDDLLDGGLIKNRTIVIQGDAGTGKSTMGMQFLVNGARNYNESGLMLAIEYDKIDIINDMSNFDWPINELIKNKKLSIVSLPGGLENPNNLTLDDLVNFIYEETKKINASRLVIDSMNSLEIIFKNNKDKRKELIRFTTLLRDLNCTIILLSEKSTLDTDLYTYTAHGVISMYNFRNGADRLRAIEIMKMRGINHSTLTHSMRIVNGIGIEVLPHEIDMKIR